MQYRSAPATNAAGSVPSCAQVCPKSALWADETTVPSLTSAVQSAVLVHVTLGKVSAPGGAVAGFHVTPLSWVVTTTSLPGSGAPFVPTAMHAVRVGQDTALSCGVDPPT